MKPANVRWGETLGVVLMGLSLTACPSEQSTKDRAESAGAAGTSGRVQGGGAGGDETGHAVATSGTSGERGGGTTLSSGASGKGDPGTAGGGLGGDATLAGGAGVQGDPGAPHPGGAGGAPSEITSDTIGDLVFGAYCDLLKACEPELGPSFAVRERCLQVMDAGLGDGFDHPVFWARGTSLYEVDTSRAHACLSKIEGAGCTDGLPLTEVVESCHGMSARSFFGNQLQHLLDALPECQGAMLGTLAEEACCDYRGGCGPGLFCEETDGIGTCLPPGGAHENCDSRPCEKGMLCVLGQCEPLAQPGDECVQAGDGSNCVEGLYCDDSQEPPRCATANKPEGASCDCLDCAEGLYCKTNTNPSVCIAYKQQDDACQNGEKCAAGLGCMAGTCRKDLPLTIGEECISGYSGCAGSPLSRSRCVDDGTGVDRCSAQDETLRDAPCDPDGDSDRGCAGTYDLVCDKTSRTCQPVPALGETCDVLCADFVNVYCAYAHTTDTSGTCQPRLAEGGDCSQDFPDEGSDPVCEAGVACSASSSSSANSFGSACRLALKCDKDTRTCVARARQTCQ